MSGIIATGGQVGGLRFIKEKGGGLLAGGALRTPLRGNRVRSGHPISCLSRVLLLWPSPQPSLGIASLPFPQLLNQPQASFS